VESCRSSGAQKSGGRRETVLRETGSDCRSVVRGARWEMGGSLDLYDTVSWVNPEIDHGLN